MSAQPNHPKKPGWRHRIAQWLDPVIPQLAATAQNWSPVPNPCPEHPETSMQKVTGPDGLPAWKCPRCGTDAMKPVQVVDKPSPLRPRGARREFLTALGMKPLPPKPAMLQTHPDLPKLPPASPHADVQFTMLPPTRHDLPHMAPVVKQEVISTLRTVPSRPLVPDTPTLHGEDAWIRDKPMQSAPLPPIIASIEVWGEPDEPKQVTGYMDELATLRHNSDTLEVPAYVKQKHTKESE